MKKSATMFLQAVIVLIGLGICAALLWEPQLEGRNAHATQFEIYFKDPFLAYLYLSSLPFFYALYEAWKVLTHMRNNTIFSHTALRSVQTIKYCALILIGCILGAEAYIFFFIRGTDDVAGGVAMGLLMLTIATIAATAAAVFERLLENGIEIQAENELTI